MTIYSPTYSSIEDDVHNQVIASLQADADVASLLDDVTEAKSGQIFRAWDVDHDLKGAFIIVDAADEGEAEGSVPEQGNAILRVRLTITVGVSNMIDPQTLSDHGKHAPHDYFEAVCATVHEWLWKNQMAFLQPKWWNLADNQHFEYQGSAAGRTDDGWLCRSFSVALFFNRRAEMYTTTTTTTAA